MQQPEVISSPFGVGDLVQPKEASDLPLLFTGKRTEPGEIVLITEYGGLMVAGKDGRALPYGPHELEKADD